MRVLVNSDYVLQRVHDGAVSAVKGLDYDVIVQSGQGRGSVTVQSSAGQERCLLYLVGEYTAREVESFKADSGCDVYEIRPAEFDVITEEFAVDHIQKWLFKGA
mgnify:CR=1 FL=1